MKREIIVKVVIDWNDYEDTCDELILEDSGIYENLKDGVSIELNKHKVSNNEVACCGNCHLPLDNIEYIKKEQIANKKYNK